MWWIGYFDDILLQGFGFMIKTRCFVLFIAVIAGLSTTNLSAADSAAIEQLRTSIGTAKLSPTDVQVVNDFISECAREMLLAKDLSQVSQIRSMIVMQKGTRPSQYAVEFASAVKKTLDSAFSQVATLEQGPRRTHIELNLVILAAEIKSIRLADFGLKLIGHDNSAIRYWAIKTIASPEIAKQLNSLATADAELKTKIITALSRSVKSGLHPSCLALVVNFIEASGPKDRDVSDLTHQIAVRRIAEYENWTIKYELLDASLLKILTKCTLNAETTSKRALCARNFAQLYSYVMQRYLIGQEILSPTSKQQLASVMVETERFSMGPGKFLGRSQTAIRQAISKKKIQDLKREHDTLFGTAGRTGRLAAELKFNYGTGKTGNPVTAPKKLMLPKIK